MNAHIVVGVGNIYASEALFMAGINPRRAAGRIARSRYDQLADAIKEVLGKAIKAGGTTLRDFYGISCKELLCQDIKDGAYPLLSPMELWNMRPQYKLFDLNVFRGRIYQEIRHTKFDQLVRDEAPTEGGKSKTSQLQLHILESIALHSFTLLLALLPRRWQQDD